MSISLRYPFERLSKFSCYPLIVSMSARRGRDRGQGSTTTNGQYPAIAETNFLYQSPLIRLFNSLMIPRSSRKKLWYILHGTQTPDGSELFVWMNCLLWLLWLIGIFWLFKPKKMDCIHISVYSLGYSDLSLESIPNVWELWKIKFIYLFFWVPVYSTSG